MEPPAAQAESLVARATIAMRVYRLPIVVSGLILVVHPIVLRLEGRRWWCACGRPFLWSGNVHSSHYSQHLADPYSFSHVEHGILFYGLFTWLWPRMSVGWRFVLTLAVEAGWEIVENTNGSSIVTARRRFRWTISATPSAIRSATCSLARLAFILRGESVSGPSLAIVVVDRDRDARCASATTCCSMS